MKHLTRLPLFVLFLATTAVAAQDRFAPDGWRFPAKEDQKDGWVTFAEPGRAPYHTQADFNGLTGRLRCGT